MTNQQLQEYVNKQKKLSAIIGESSEKITELNMENCAEMFQSIREKIASDSFKIMVMGNFKNGKSTFINAILGQEILPAYAIPTTAIINEVKYGVTPKAVLHFLNPLPEKIYKGISEKVYNYMEKYDKENIPPMEIPVEEIEDYVVIPTGMNQSEASAQSPFEKLELFWPLDLLKNCIEIVDSPGLNENPIRTQVTMEYLNKADAIIFVFSALAYGSFSELSFIDDVLIRNGFGEQSIFYVVNRFDQVNGDRERQRVKEFAERTLEPYTKSVYYTSAYQGLKGKLENDEDMLKESMMPSLEEALSNYLINERGKIKLATPSRELLRIIRKDVLETTIPQRRKAYATDLEVLKKRYSDVQPEINKVEQKKELIVSKTEATIVNMLPDIRRSALTYVNNIPGKIRAWMDEYNPQSKVSMLHIKRDVEVLAEELNEYLQKAIDSDMREWLAGPFTQLVNDKVNSLKDMLEGRLEEFFVSVDNIKIEVTGCESVVEEIPVWKRAVAAGGGWFFGGIAGGMIGATTGLSKELAKTVALDVAAMLTLFLLGALNPITLIGTIAASALFGSKITAAGAVTKAKDKMADSYCETISQNSVQMSEKIIDGAMENFEKVKEVIAKSMSAEIEEMKKQLEGIIADVEKGKENVEQKTLKLNELEDDLRKTAESLDDFIFELLKS